MSCKTARKFTLVQ